MIVSSNTAPSRFSPPCPERMPIHSVNVFLHITYSPSECMMLTSPPYLHQVTLCPPGSDVAVTVTGSGDSSANYLSDTVCPLIVQLLTCENALPASRMKAPNNVGRELIGRVRAFLDETVDCEGVLTATVVDDIMAASKMKNLF